MFLSLFDVEAHAKEPNLRRSRSKPAAISASDMMARTRIGRAREQERYSAGFNRTAITVALSWCGSRNCSTSRISPLATASAPSAP